MRSKLLQSTAFRLSLRYALLYSILTACVLLTAYLMARRELREWVEDDVRSQISEIEVHAASDASHGLIEEVNLRAAFNSRSNLIFQLTDIEGKWLAGNARGIPEFRKRLVVSEDDITISSKLNDDATEFIVRDTEIGDARLAVGKSLHLLSEASDVLAEAMAAGLALLLLTGLGLGFLLGRRTEQRIIGIRTALLDAADGNLARRAPVDGRTDDLSRVSEAINDALDRLQALVESQHQISADIAHDLKTPIQRLRQRLERAKPGDEKTALVVEESIADADAIISTFQALLRIAQIEGGARRERFQSVDLIEICQSVASAFEAVAEDEGHSFVCDVPGAPVPVFGDRELLTQLAANLVENAIRHCPQPAAIVLRVFVDDDVPCLQVTDTGPGIPADERERVLRRLYRLEKSRTTSGNGLGLSMVKAISDLHGAKIGLGDNEPGLSVTVSFPPLK